MKRTFHNQAIDGYSNAKDLVSALKEAKQRAIQNTISEKAEPDEPTFEFSTDMVIDLAEKAVRLEAVIMIAKLAEVMNKDGKNATNSLDEARRILRVAQIGLLDER
ncbi:hypothetical protein [Paenilisteria newyorkensis]|uniref:hypothetical protein n=1 Tax=Listeria newyorkensis TaxID=1497681 RepID=UPI000669DA56|nr:hypothetical protein [Listeria newyorkensis]KMT58921.1 hypothetical protein X559_2927 [Listeria newyorkensis]